MELNSLIKQGYFLKYLRKNDETEFSHIFCGSHSVEGAWCPNCQKPLLRFLALDTNDPMLGLEKTPFQWLSLFFCWTCEIAQTPFYYCFAANGDVQLLKYGEGGVQLNFPTENYPTYFPQAHFRFKPLTEKEQITIKRLNRDQIDEGKPLHLNRPEHQIGGEPFLVQKNPDFQTDAWGKKTLTCPKCKKLMPFLVAIGEKTRGKQGFSGNEYVQVIFNYCQRDRIICAFQQCE
jgi:thiol-disulfide isomerase/thioredoxin